MTKYGIEVAQGKDTEEAEPRELLYSSLFQSLKLDKVYKGTFKTNADGNATVEVNHGLFYAPMVLAFFKPEGGYWSAINNSDMGLFTSNTKVTIKTDYASFPSLSTSPFAANTIHYYKFWVFQDPAEEL